MARRKSPPQPMAHGGEVRVDNTLVRNYRARQRTHELLATRQAQHLSVEEARKLAAQIRKKGPQAIEALFECLFDEKNADKHRLAILLLSEINDPAVSERIHTLLLRPQLPERVRVALLAIEALHESAPDKIAVTPEFTGVSLDSILQFTENFWDALEMEEIALMWRENFIAEPPEGRLAMLEALLRSANPKLLGIVRLEIMTGDAKVLQFLAQRLGAFDSPLAQRMLKMLLEHPDLVVRTMADTSLNQLRERAAGASNEAGAQPAAARFYRAHMATDEWSGHYSLVYAVKYPPDDLIKFTVFLLDRWDRGVVDCWGCVRYNDQEFEQLLASMAKDFADLRQERISKRTALTLLSNALDLNLRRKRSLPLEFGIWCHLFENERFEPDPNVPEFGADCSACGKPIRTGPRTAPPWVFNDLIVCNRCSRRSLRCPTCGGSTTLAKCLASCEESRDQIDLRCPHCFESFRLAR